MTGDADRLAKMVKVYLKIKEKRTALLREFEEADSSLKSQADKVKAGMLDYCKANGVESVRTSEGLFYRTTRTKYWTSDWESFNRFVVEHECPELLEKRINQGVMKEFLDQNPEEVPPGLNAEVQYSVSVRRK